ncbi:MAG: hypothetical protein ISP90_16395 [Nevskia sp.]|nr:hypothetical protein [Nevskia sp.]
MWEVSGQAQHINGGVRRGSLAPEFPAAASTLWSKTRAVRHGLWAASVLTAAAAVLLLRALVAAVYSH